MSWIQRAKVGDKVVCIKAELHVGDRVELLEKPKLPVVGKVYTIRDVVVGILSEKPCLALEEIPEQWIRIRLDGEPSRGWVIFQAEDFRPVEPRKTDISFAHEILRKATKPVEERA